MKLSNWVREKNIDGQKWNFPQSFNIVNYEVYSFVFIYLEFNKNSSSHNFVINLVLYQYNSES